MIKKTFITLVISLFIINYSHSKENFFADAKNYLTIRNTKNQNSYFKEILYLIQKKQNHTYF